MEHVERLHRPGPIRVWLGVGLLAVITFFVMVIGRASPATPASVLVAAMVVAIGVMAMAALLAPVTPFPRWAHWNSSVILAVWVFAGPALAGSPAAWVANQRENVWMMPWFVLTMSGLARVAGRGICATTGALGGWMLIASSAVFPGIFVLVDWIVGRR